MIIINLLAALIHLIFFINVFPFFSEKWIHVKKQKQKQKQNSSLSHNVSESEKKNPRSTPKDNGVYSVLGRIIHPSSVKICSVVFVWSCWQTNQKHDIVGKKLEILQMFWERLMYHLKQKVQRIQTWHRDFPHYYPSCFVLFAFKWHPAGELVPLTVYFDAQQ